MQNSCLIGVSIQRIYFSNINIHTFIHGLENTLSYAKVWGVKTTLKETLYFITASIHISDKHINPIYKH